MAIFDGCKKYHLRLLFLSLDLIVRIAFFKINLSTPKDIAYNEWYKNW